MLRRNSNVSIASVVSAAIVTACVLPEYTNDRESPGDGGNYNVGGYGITGQRGGATGVHGGTAGAATALARGGTTDRGIDSAGSGNWNSLGGALNSTSGNAGVGITAGSPTGGFLGFGGATNGTGAQPFGGTSSGGLTQTGGTSLTGRNGGSTALGGTTSVVAGAGTTATSPNGGTSVSAGGSSATANGGVSGGGIGNLSTAGAAAVSGRDSTPGGNTSAGTTTTGLGGATGGTGGGGAGGTCDAGWGNCDASSDGSCEQDLTGSDARYCGSCTKACGNCTNDCSDATSKPPVCGTMRQTVAARCYNTIDVWGFKSDNASYYQGRSAEHLHAVRRNIGSSTDPILFSMGIWEANSGIHYYLALYKGGGTNNYPAALVWSSGLQISQGARESHYRNEVGVSPPIPLEVGADYWQAVLIHDASGDVTSLEIATHGPLSARTEDQLAYSNLVLPPASLLNVPPADDEYRFQSLGLFIRVARP